MKASFVGVLFFGALASSLNAGGPGERFNGLPASELLDKAKGYSPGAIRELGLRKEKAAFSILRSIAEEPDLPEPAKAPTRADGRAAPVNTWERNLSHREAKIALARLGSKKWLDHFISGLSSPNIPERQRSISALGRIGDRRAVSHLIPFLDDQSTVSSDPTSPSSAMLAMMAIPDIAPESLSTLGVQSGGKSTGSKIERIKGWWRANKDAFPVGAPSPN